jgi:hypothetical protein
MSLWEHIRDNGIQNSENAVLVISWFNSPVIWDTVSKIFELLKLNNISAFALEKPWHFSREEESSFSLTRLTDEIEESIGILSSQWYNDIKLIGSSLSALPVSIAANRIWSWVSWNILLSPALDVKKALVNRWQQWVLGIPFGKIPWLWFREFKNERGVTDFDISWWRLSLMDKLFTNVNIDRSQFELDMIQFWARDKSEIKAMIGSVPTTIIRNQRDKIISPRFIDTLWLEVLDGPTVDKAQHTISTSDVSDIIVKKIRWVLPEISKLQVA